MASVKKRDGSEQAYDPEKVKASIKKAFIDAGDSIEEKRDVIENIAGEVTSDIVEKGEETTKTIKVKILSSLDDAQESAGQAWRRFDERYKKNADGGS